MSFKPKFTTEKKTEPIPEGQYDARCYGVAELGHIKRFNSFKGLEENVNEMILFFEIPELMITFDQDGHEVTKPRATYPRFKVSMHEKAKLRQFIEAWFGKKFKTDEEAVNFDFGKLIGYGATLSMQVSEGKDGKEYSNIVTIGPLHKSVKLPAQNNESINFGMDDINSPEFDKLYPWVQKRIKESVEYLNMPEENTDPEINVDEEEDDIPF